MSATDQLVTNNATYVQSFDKGALPLPPAKKVAYWPAWTPDWTPPASSAWKRVTPT